MKPAMPGSHMEQEALDDPVGGAMIFRLHVLSGSSSNGNDLPDLILTF